MKMLVLLLLCSCAGPMPATPGLSAACVTDNMLVVLDPAPAGWCDEVQEVEDRIFDAFREVAPYDARFGSSKARVRGWAIVVVPELSWSNTGGTNVIGQTDCDNRVVYVNNNRPAAGPLGHELAHAVENCKPLEPWDLHDYYHSNWAPIYAALRKHNLRP